MTSKTPLDEYGIADLFDDYTPQQQQEVADSIKEMIASAGPVEHDWATSLRSLVQIVRKSSQEDPEKYAGTFAMIHDESEMIARSADN